MSLKLKAKAIVAVRRRREAAKKTKAEHNAARERKALIDDITANLTLPPTECNKDAPTLEEVVAATIPEIVPLLPKSQHTTVEQKVDFGDIEEFVKGLLPAEDLSERPKVEVIREEIDIEQLGEFVTKEDLDEALLRVQRAIQESSGGGGGAGEAISQLSNVIQVDSDTTITSDQLLANRINVILVTVEGITVTLPEPDVTKLMFIQQSYTGTGTFQVCKP